MKRQVLILTLIIIAAAAVRWPEMNRTGLWLDEGLSLTKSSRCLPEMLRMDPNPPNYYLYLKVWVSVLGSSQVSLRLPSFFSGLASVLLVYFLGRRLFGFPGACFSAGLMIVSPLQIYFSSEARMYGPEILFSLLSMWFFLNVIEKNQTLSWWGYLGSTIFLCYLHNFAVAVPLAQNSYIVFCLIKKKGLPHQGFIAHWFKFQGLLFLLYLPWLVIFIRNTIAIKGDWWTPPLSWGELANTFSLYGGGYPLFVILSVLAFLGLIFSKKRTGFLFLSFLIPLSLPILASLLFPVYVVRITLPAHAPFLLLAGAGFSCLAARPRIFICVGIGFLAVSSLIFFYQTQVRSPLREVAQWLAADERPGQVLVSPFWHRNVIGWYYSVGSNRRVSGFDHELLKKKSLEIKNSKIKEGLPSGWLVDCEGLVMGKIKNNEELFNSSFYIEKIFPYFNFQAGRKEEVTIIRFE